MEINVNVVQQQTFPSQYRLSMKYFNNTNQIILDQNVEHWKPKYELLMKKKQDEEETYMHQIEAVFFR